MVATVGNPFAQQNQVTRGGGYDGVVRISVNGHYGTGALLYGGRAVLTAAHLFSSVDKATVLFDTVSGASSMTSFRCLLRPDYDSVNTNNDLAIIWLDAAAPVSANRYELYRASNELGQKFSFVGYGIPGTGAAGADYAYHGQAVRQQAVNQFDLDAGVLKSALGGEMGWNPLVGTQLVADFDSGSARNDAIGLLENLYNYGLGQQEGGLTPGDSGGPAFLEGKIAGVASYTASLPVGAYSPDVDAVSNSSFGEMGFWQRVSSYQQWIDQSLRGGYTNVPTGPGQVVKQVQEGATGGVTLTYFLVQFTGTRSDEGAWVSVDYATRDGSAKAGEDYLAASGKLVLYPGETQAVIPVEIVGDAAKEPDETFYLDITNPVGGALVKG